MGPSARERAVISLLVAGFLIGTTTHILHLVNVGWVVFETAPAWMNVYWTALTVLDPIAAMMLVRHRRVGLALGILIMVSDVALNSYALYGLRLPFGFVSLQAQTVFCGFLLGAASFLARRPQAKSPQLSQPVS